MPVPKWCMPVCIAECLAAPFLCPRVHTGASLLPRLRNLPQESTGRLQGLCMLCICTNKHMCCLQSKHVHIRIHAHVCAHGMCTNTHTHARTHVRTHLRLSSVMQRPRAPAPPMLTYASASLAPAPSSMLPAVGPTTLLFLCTSASTTQLTLLPCTAPQKHTQRGRSACAYVCTYVCSLVRVCVYVCVCVCMCVCVCTSVCVYARECVQACACVRMYV